MPETQNESPAFFFRDLYLHGKRKFETIPIVMKLTVQNSSSMPTGKRKEVANGTGCTKHDGTGNGLFHHDGNLSVCGIAPADRYSGYVLENRQRLGKAVRKMTLTRDNVQKIIERSMAYGMPRTKEEILEIVNLVTAHVYSPDTVRMIVDTVIDRMKKRGELEWRWDNDSMSPYYMLKR